MARSRATFLVALVVLLLFFFLWNTQIPGHALDCLLLFAHQGVEQTQPPVLPGSEVVRDVFRRWLHWW